MSGVLPSPAHARAIVVGIESYPDLGDSFNIRGAAAGAIAFARWLVNERNVPAGGIELWLSLLDGSTAATACLNAGLGGTVARDFIWADFRRAMNEPRGAFADGEFLMVYFCGHGVVTGARNDQYLVLPEASASQFRCFEVQNWRELFRGSGWQRYERQLWIIDACRNQWGDAMKPVPDQWHAGMPQPVRQCAMFACASGESAAIDSREGPLFTRRLLATMRAEAVDVHGWPAFDQALKDTAQQLRAEPRVSQNPVLSIGEDWFGMPMVGEGLAGRGLRELLSDLAWPYKRFEPYVMGAQMRSFRGFASPGDLDRAIELLHALPSVDGVPPMMDFAERVARAAPSPELRAWVKARLSNQQWAELDARLAAHVGSARLSLWYRDDASQPCIEGELDVIEAGAGCRAWQRATAKPVTPETVGATIGQWIRAVHTHMGDHAMDLVVELYLPRELLTATAYDTATVPIDAGEELRLGEDHAALLRCTDRYKGPTKRLRWRRHAPQILARLAQRTADPLRWAASGENLTGLKSAFLANADTAPVWLGFEPEICGGEAPLDFALEEGLPAVIWLRGGNDVESMDALRTGLQELLKTPLEQLPARLIDWRAGCRGDASKTVSLLLDDPARTPAILTSWTQPGG